MKKLTLIVLLFGTLVGQAQDVTCAAYCIPQNIDPMTIVPSSSEATSQAARELLLVVQAADRDHAWSLITAKCNDQNPEGTLYWLDGDAWPERVTEKRFKNPSTGCF